MAVSKKISQLTALASASLNTQVVGVDGGSTIRVSLNTIKDVVATTINDTNDARLDSLEQYTSSAVGANVTSLNSFTSSYFIDSASFSTRIAAATNEQSFAELISGSSQLTASFDQRYTLSGSITQTTWSNISGKPLGIVSQSTDLTSLNQFTQSANSRLNGIESSTGSYLTSLNGTITSSAQITALGFISSSTQTDISSLNTFTQSIDGRVDSLESWSSSLTNTFATDLEVSVISSSVAATIGIISTNAGLVTTSSFNSYTASISTGSLVNRLNAIESLSGSWITESETGSFLTFLPVGTISGSSQITSLGFISSSTTPVGTISSSAQITSFGFVSGSYLTSLDGAISSSSQITSSLDLRYQLSGSAGVVPAGTISGSSQITSFGFVSSSITIPNGTISSSAQITSLGFVSGSYLTSLSGAISSSTQLTSSFELKGIGIYSSSVQLPSGLISGSSQLPSGVVSSSIQLTSSLDLRYQLSGSAGVVPAGTISGSSQLTSSFDNRYVLETETGSLQNSISLLNALTASLATTGSNSFNGNQTITGSLIVSSVAVVNGGVTIPTGSILSLTTGSSIFVDSSGAITGSLTGSVFGIGDVVTFSTSVNSRISSIITSSLATTGSNTFVGTETISGSLLVSGSISVSSGSITMPNRPGVRVYGAGGAKVAVTPLTGSYLIMDWQQSNAWDNSTGTFTAPIAGLYQVNVVVRTNSNSLGTISQLIVYKNYTGVGTGTAQIMVEFGTNTTMNHAGGSTICKLAVGDTLRMVVAVGEISFDANDNFSVAYIG